MIVLTGGAGFIGSAMLRHLNEEGVDDIIVVDRIHGPAKWKNLLGKRFRYLMLPDELIAYLKSDIHSTIEAILHFGARTNTTDQNIEFLIENNYRYSVKLAEYALEHGIPFIHTSSASIYGDGSQGYDPSRTVGLRPLNPYAFSKYIFDLWVQANNVQDDVTILRLFNVYGPNEYHKLDMASMVYKSFVQIQRTGKVHLFESNTSEYSHGEQKRDFIYIKDVVSIVWYVLQTYKGSRPISGIHNLGTGVARSWNELANAVFAAMERTPQIVYIRMPDELLAQYQNYTQADVSTLEQALNRAGYTFAPTSLEDGVIDYVRNYLLNSWQYL